MKTSRCLRRWIFLFAIFFSVHSLSAQSTGRVVINEYMPWPSNGCGTGSEFVELLNFGPGPVDLGCYILTTGRYAITIPPGTVLQPGAFFVLSGQNVIPGNCANIDSTAGVHSNLNWNTCNCTNVPIPATGDGMMTDGGAGNTPLVLLDPSLTVVDAVVRSLPAEPAVSITTSNVSGRCGAKTFDLSRMNINYEQLGMSAGRANSFARTVDGDCEWVKDPQQSAHASNNRSGDLSAVGYNLALLTPFLCNQQTGRANVFVNYSNYAAIFPMKCLLAHDVDSNGVFDFGDAYTSFTDSTAPVIEMNGLQLGHYRLTVSTAMDCSLKTFEFTINGCTVLLPVELVYFTYTGEQNNSHRLQWKLQAVENLQKTVVQKAQENGPFVDDLIVEPKAGANGSAVYSAVADENYRLFRLKMISKTGRETYSPTIHASAPEGLNKLWPNPVSESLYLQLTSQAAQKASYRIYSLSGILEKTGELSLAKDKGIYILPLADLAPGLHNLLVVSQAGNNQPGYFRFVKQ